MNRIFLLIVPIILATFSTEAHAQKVWTSFTASDAVYGIALQGNYVWCATANGPVRYDKRDMSYQIFNTIPDNRVTCVTVDTGGNVWFGSQNGLHRWDGSAWKSYYKDSGLPDSKVNQVAAGNNNDIWIGTYILTPGEFIDTFSKKLSNFDGSKFSVFFSKSGFTNNSTIASGPLASFVIFSPTDVWLEDMVNNYRGTGNITHFDGSEFKNISLNNGPPDGTMRQITAGLGKSLWITANGKVYKSDGSTCTVVSDSLGITTALATDASGNVYVAALSDDTVKKSSLFRYNGVQWTSSFIGTGDSLAVSTLAVDDQGVVLAGAPAGLFELKNNVWSRYTTQNRLPDNDIRKIAVDSYGTVWAATPNRLMQYDGKVWKTITTITVLPDSVVNAITPAPDGSVWFGTGKGIIRYTNGIWKTFGEQDGLASFTEIYSIQSAPDGIIWIRTSAGFYRFQNEKWVNYPVELTEEEKGYFDLTKNAWTIDRSGLLWRAALSDHRSFTFDLITPQKIITWSESSSTITPWEYSPAIAFLSIPDTTLWMGLSGYHGVHNPNFFSCLENLKNGDIVKVRVMDGSLTSFAIDPDKSLWIGLHSYFFVGIYKGGGLYHFEKSGNTLSNYTSDDGLIDNSVTCLAAAPDGAVWAGTSSGVSRYGGPLQPIITHVEDTLPVSMTILSNYPNPFNPSTVITFSLYTHSRVNLNVYSVTGQKVRTLSNSLLTAGTHSIVWDGRDDSGRAVSSGVYLSRLQMGNKVAIGRMLLLK